MSALKSTSKVSLAHTITNTQGVRSGRFFLVLSVPALQFAIDSVGVLAATARSVYPVVAALACLQTPFDGQVA